MTYCDGGSMLDYLNKTNGSISDHDVFTSFYDACRAVKHMHSMSPPIIHRDIKVLIYL